MLPDTGERYLGTCCIYETTGGEAIREHARRAGMPGDDFVPIGATVVIRPDPA